MLYGTLVLQVSRQSPAFFASMRSTAQRESMSVGALLGRVLPFTEETSSNDQSKVDKSIDSKCDIPEMKALRSSAIAIRSMIRVKMADENDFKQVWIICSSSSRSTTKHCSNVIFLIFRRKT
jgi:hypothetical protein